MVLSFRIRFGEDRTRQLIVPMSMSDIPTCIRSRIWPSSSPFAVLKCLEAEQLDVYERSGFSRIYGMFARIPLKYFQDKFKKMICLVAEKEKVVAELERCPCVYDARGNWEFIKSTAESRTPPCESST